MTVIKHTEKVTVEMSPREYKKFVAWQEAEKIARSIKRGLQEVARTTKLKAAHALANEI